MTRLAYSVAVIFMASAFLFVAQTAQAEQGTRDKIRQLIELDGAAAVADAVIDRQRPVVRQKFLAAHPGVANKVADAYVDAFAAELTARRGQFVDLIVDVYAKMFTADEIEQLLAFHASPVGQKLRAATPAILARGREAGVAWGKENGAAVSAAAMARLKAMGYAVK